MRWRNQNKEEVSMATERKTWKPLKGNCRHFLPQNLLELVVVVVLRCVKK